MINHFLFSFRHHNINGPRELPQAILSDVHMSKRASSTVAFLYVTDWYPYLVYCISSPCPWAQLWCFFIYSFSVTLAPFLVYRTQLSPHNMYIYCYVPNNHSSFSIVIYTYLHVRIFAGFPYNIRVYFYR